MTKDENDNVKKTKLTYGFITTIFVGSLFFTITANAQALFVPDAGTMLHNFIVAVPALMQLVTAMGYVMGFFFVLKGVYGLKQYGESRSMMSSDRTLMGPLLQMMIGSLLIYLPTSVQVGTSTFFGTPNPYRYMQDSSSAGQWATLYNDVFMIIQLIGVIAFIRGMVLLSHISSSSGQQGQMGKALSHIIGGIFCINMYPFLQVVFNTLGYGQF